MGVNIDPLERVRAALGVPDPAPDEMKLAPVAGARGTTVVVFTGTDRRSYYVDGDGVVYRMPSSCGSPAAFERLDPSLLPGLRVG